MFYYDEENDNVISFSSISITKYNFAGKYNIKLSEIGSAE